MVERYRRQKGKSELLGNHQKCWLWGRHVVMETLRLSKHQVKGFAYASSAGVYGPQSMYPGGVLKHDSPLYPTHLYGVHKQADEGMARIYDRDYGVRPFKRLPTRSTANANSRPPPRMKGVVMRV